MTPTEALKADDPALWKVQYLKVNPSKDNLRKLKSPKFTFEIGDVVRLSKIQSPFDKEANPKWTEELFTVSSRYKNQGFQKYNVKDFQNEAIIDSFLPNELQKVEVDKDTTYDIEKILKERKRKGKKEVLVRWKGWPPKFDTWILAKDIDHYK